MRVEGGGNAARNSVRTELQWYSPILDTLERQFGARFWITGGWARATILPSDYMGDIDTIVCATAREIADVLTSSGFEPGKAPLGGLRIVLPDKNHMDIIAAAGTSVNEAVLASLEAFNFSINSVAINYSTGEMLRTPHNSIDSETASFRVNEQFDFMVPEITLARDFEIFEKFYRLRPVDTPPTLSVDKLVQNCSAAEASCDAAEVLARRSEELSPFVPDNTDAWIVRGTVRCALLGQMRYWDDVDVVINCTNDAMRARLSELNVPYVLNFYGHPKVILKNGRKADIWPLKKRDSLFDELAEYAHNIDSIAWSMNEQRLSDPLGVKGALLNRFLDINPLFLQNATTHDLQYTALKSIYLIVRHRMAFSQSVSQLVKIPMKAHPFLVKHLIKLMRELCLCMPRPDVEQSLCGLARKLGDCDAINLIRQYGRISVEI